MTLLPTMDRRQHPHSRPTVPRVTTTPRTHRQSHRRPRDSRLIVGTRLAVTRTAAICSLDRRPRRAGHHHPVGPSMSGRFLPRRLRPRGGTIPRSTAGRIIAISGCQRRTSHRYQPRHYLSPNQPRIARNPSNGRCTENRGSARTEGINVIYNFVSLPPPAFYWYVHFYFWFCRRRDVM